MYHEIEAVVEVGGVDDNKRMEETTVERKKQTHQATDLRAHRGAASQC